MKKTQQDRELKRRLALVRSTIRSLTPGELADVQGGGDIPTVGCSRTRFDFDER